MQEADWVGYWITPTGLKPWSKMIRAIKAMQAPTYIKQVHLFIGAVTYCCDMWPRCSHILAPLTDLAGKGTFKWNTIHQHAFDAMKACGSHTLCCVPTQTPGVHLRVQSLECHVLLLSATEAV